MGNPADSSPARKAYAESEAVWPLQTVIFSILYSENGSSYDVQNDPTVSRIAAKWAGGDIKGIKRVDELLAQAGLSMAAVDLQSLSESNTSHELDRLDERDERLLGVATRFCVKSSGGAWAGRSWCGVRARRLLKANSMSCRLAHPISRLIATHPMIQAAGRSRRSSQRQGRSDDRKRPAGKSQSRTRAGKAVARLNALRHGLAAVLHYDPGADHEIEELADAIVGAERGRQLLALARRVADAELGLRHVKSAQMVLADSRPPPSLGRTVIPLTSLGKDFEAGALDRYEKRVRSRRKFAIRDYEAARVALPTRRRPIEKCPSE